ncbi:hypothetical protein PENSPDRAFT_756269 [Peniophora sp. CONT]|nr:hypothetical protein PENSPDRAFT_756269 [Peniophora sp. CONT]
MGQYWNLFNIDKRQKAKNVNGRFDSFIFMGHDWLVKLLARPEFPDVAPALHLSPAANNKSEIGSFAVLPAELITVIYSSISSLDDAACFAATHRLLAAEGFRRVLELRREECAHWGSWAGDRIVTAGDYADILPQGVLTPSEDAETEGHFYSFAWDHYQHNIPLANMSFDGKEPYVGFEYQDIEDEYGDVIDRIRIEVPKTAMQRVSRDVTGDYLRVQLLLESTAPRYLSRGTWALCNLSRKQYVRADALASMEILDYWQAGCTADGPFLKGERLVLDLGALAMIMTSWSEDVGPVGTLSVWAGDRLAVTTVEELAGGGWEDVSSTGQRLAEECVIANDSVLWRPS